MNGENRRLKKTEVCAKRSIKRQLHTTHMGAVRWEPQSSSTTTCKGKVDHELPVNYSKGHTHTNPRPGHYVTHAHSHIMRAVAAVDSCFALTVTCDQAFFFKSGRGERKKNSSRERHKGIIGTGYDLRVPLLGLISTA